MSSMVICVLCMQFGGILMNVAQHAGDAEAHCVFNSLVDEAVSMTELLQSNKSPTVPLRTVSVTCSPAAMEVRVKADLFDFGTPVNPEHVTLGERCGVTKASSEEFIIHTALTDCGTLYWLTSDALVYTNILVYAPITSLHGVIRQEKTIVPVECVYRRRFGVDHVSLVPTWVPYLSVHSTDYSLSFTLDLMTADWQTLRGGMYFLGDVMNIEVSVFSPLLGLRVFAQNCVATMTHDVNSVPRYKFIQNGCFTDRQKTSFFLPRIQSNKLQFQLHTFIFRQVNSSKIFISCSMKADFQSSFSSRACSYIQGSWRSVDGDDRVCKSCQAVDQFRWKQKDKTQTQAGSVLMEPKEPAFGASGSTWKMSELGDLQVFQKEVGPVSLLRRSDVLPPAVLEGVHILHIPLDKSKQLTAHSLQKNLW